MRGPGGREAAEEHRQGGAARLGLHLEALQDLSRHRLAGLEPRQIGEKARDAAQLVGPARASGALREVRRDLARHRGRELAVEPLRQSAVDACARHGVAPSSTRSRSRTRIASRARDRRLFTVPSGTPSAARHLLAREPLHLPQDEHRAVLEAQLQEGGLDPPRPLPLARRLVRARVRALPGARRPLDEEALVERLLPVPATTVPEAAPVVTLVHRDAVDPGLEAAAALEPAQHAIDLQEHLLGHVPRFLGVAEKAGGQVDDHALVEPDEPGEGGGVAGTAGSDECAVLNGSREGLRLEWHLTRAHRDPPAALHELGHRSAPGRSPGTSYSFGRAAIPLPMPGDPPPGGQGGRRGQPSQAGQDEQADRGRPLGDTRRRRHRGEGGQGGEPAPGVQPREPAQERDGAQPGGEGDREPRQGPERREPFSRAAVPTTAPGPRTRRPAPATARSGRASASPAPRRPRSGRRSRASPGCPPSRRRRARTGCAAG